MSPQIIHRLETRAACSSLVCQAVGVLSLRCSPPTGVRVLPALCWTGLVWWLQSLEPLCFAASLLQTATTANKEKQGKQRGECRLSADCRMNTKNKNPLKLHEGSEVFVPAQLALKGKNRQVFPLKQ